MRPRTSTLTTITLILFTLGCDVARSSGAGGPTPGGPDAPSGGRNYRIAQGDTLYSIAAREYGDPLQWIRLQEANTWFTRPESLPAGQTLFIPNLPEEKNRYNVDPANLDLEKPMEQPRGNVKIAQNDPRREQEPDDGLFGLRNMFRNIGGKTFMGASIQKLGAAGLGGFVLHALLQGFLLWIVATVSFVKDASLKKSLRTSFHTDMVTAVTVLVLGGVGLLMIHIGTNAPGAPGENNLATTVEGYLTHPVGLLIVGGAVFGLYLLLCLRFVPPAFELKKSQSTAMVFLAILFPHLSAAYIVGQRLGLIQL